MKQYYAFISYKREDEEWAKWLQNKLEHYKLPSNLNGRSDLPKDIRPVFRDQSDLAGGVLAEEINKALENSQYLIVICSQRAARSEWVGKEVQTFIEMGRTDKIIPFIVGGEPHSENMEEECLPLSLKALPKEQELLGVNINEMGRDAAAVKVVARMFGLRFDELWQRHEREAKKRSTWIVIASVMAFLTMAGIAFWMFMQRQQTLKANWKMLETQSKFIANEVIADAKNDSYLAQMIALEILPENESHPNRPYTGEAERALRIANNYNTTVLRGNRGEINHVEFSPDGKRLLSVADQYAVRLWDVESFAEIMELKGRVVHACFSPDGKKIIAATCDSLTLWDVETGNAIWTKGGQKYCNGLKFTPDGKHVITVNDDNLIKIIDIETSELKYFPIDNNNEIEVFDISPDGKYVAYVSYNILDANGYYDPYEVPYIPDSTIYTENTIKICDIDTGKDIVSFKGHTSLISSIVFSPDCKKLVTTCYDKDIKIWDAETGFELQTMKWKLNSVAFEAVFSQDGTKIYTCHASGFIKEWDVQTGEEIKKWKAHVLEASSVAISPNGWMIASASDETTIKIWDVNADESNVVEHVANKEINTNSPEWLISPGGDILVAETYDSLYVINRNNGKSFVYNDYTCIGYGDMGRFFSPNNKYLIVVGDNELNLIDVETGEVTNSYSIDEDYFEAFAFAPDGGVITTYYDTTLHRSVVSFLDMHTDDTMHKLLLINRYGFINSISISPNMENIVIPQMFSVIVLNTKTGNDILHMTGHSSSESWVQYSPDGKYIASVDINGFTNIWDAENGKMVSKFSGSRGSYSFSQDGKHFLSRQKKNLFNVHDVETGLCVYSIESPIDTLDAAVFVNNDTQIMTVSTDGTIRIWDFPPLQELIDQTRERFKDRQLTEEERKMYYLE